MILYYLHRLFRSGQIPDIPVIIDSPLAIAATDIFRHNTQYYDTEATETLQKEHQSPISMPQLQFSRTADESKALNGLATPAIIISASGMADAGRILHHLKHNLWRAESSVLFVGFQAQGSLGRRLVEGAKKVRIMGEEIGVKASIYNLDGLSAHADRDEILDWLQGFVNKPANIFLVHGEAESAMALSVLIQQRLQMDTYIPHYGDTAVFEGRSWHVVASTAVLPLTEPAVKKLQEYLNELDNGFGECRQRLEAIVAKDSSRMPAIMERLERVRKFVRKSMEDI
jgi:metallo-beta-lactamase family protein